MRPRMSRPHRPHPQRPATRRHKTLSSHSRSSRGGCRHWRGGRWHHRLCHIARQCGGRQRQNNRSTCTGLPSHGRALAENRSPLGGPLPDKPATRLCEGSSHPTGTDTLPRSTSKNDSLSLAGQIRPANRPTLSCKENRMTQTNHAIAHVLRGLLTIGARRGRAARGRPRGG